MGSEEFAAEARMSEADFTRRRSLPLPQLVTFLLNLRKGDIQDELDEFFEVVTGRPVIQGITQSAFCQARMKLKPGALIRLTNKLLEGFKQHFSPRLWHGFRLLAVDGSTGRLPNTPDIVETFGEPPEGASVPMARFSRLYDVLNHLVIEADIEPLSTGERILAGEYLATTEINDLLLYDRGYPAFWLFAHHLREQRNFCARLPKNFCQEVEEFLHGAEKDAVVTLEARGEARKLCALYGLPSDPIQVRLIKVKLKGGEIELLATSLLDKKAYPASWFKHLYHLRWGVEEDYKREKCRVEIENFSGLSAHALFQDFHAKIFTLNLTAILDWVAQAIADRLYEHRKHPYRINFANALSKMKDNVIRLFLLPDPEDLVLQLVTALACTVEAVRPDRSYPRNIKPAKIQGFYKNYKRTR